MCRPETLTRSQKCVPEIENACPKPKMLARNLFARSQKCVPEILSARKDTRNDTQNDARNVVQNHAAGEFYVIFTGVLRRPFGEELCI